MTADEVLAKLAELPVSTWTYDWEPPHVRHMGPMAQDFAAAFGLGTDDRTIFPVDAQGVLMAAVQALYRRVLELEEKLDG